MSLGIIVAVVYLQVFSWGLNLLNWGLSGAIPVLALMEIWTYILPFATGAIVGFSNKEREESWRPRLLLNVKNCAAVVLWCSAISLTINLVSGSPTPAEYLLISTGRFAGLVLLGGMVGQPILSFAARLSIKGRHPFLYVNDVTEKIEDPNRRFIVRVVTQTLMVLLVVALAATFLAAVLALLLVALVLFFIYASLAGSSGRTVRTISIPRGGRVRDDGRIVKEGLLFDEPTGQKINEDGQVVQEGLLIDDPTGLAINKDGQVVKEGLIIDEATGVAFKDDGMGGQKVVKEGLIIDEDTGLRLDSNGRAREAGLIIDSEAGMDITGDGEVIKR